MAFSASIFDLNDRAAHWVRSAGLSAKDVARLVGGSEGTGKRIRAGLITTEQLAILARHFGWRFVTFVYEPLCGPASVAADEEAIHELKARLARIEAAVCGDSGSTALAARELAHGTRRVVAETERVN